MTQIITVSPSTAAAAAQGFRTNVKSSAQSLFEQKIAAWSEQTKTSGDAQQKAYLTVITPPALALALITMPRQAEATLAEVEQSYAQNGASEDV
ncbi:hypothetical protein LXM94_07155 [Rhizobium sp. TRM95111]|uniref:hypothetical protein n=1 Tax=Rhizobium alarense TaxID=2846851 RepID=UPI001F3288AE|nr:hypothetical protein [Rhizobium alarense]MCF3639746.1 hypothetical protein [Rhizobium alarense]